MSLKYHALLKAGTNIQEAEKIDATTSFAKHLIKCLNTGSEWLQVETIKNLKYFIHFDFVQKSLMEKYKITNSEKIKTYIKELHNGELDTSELDGFLLRELEVRQQIQNEVNEDTTSKVDDDADEIKQTLKAQIYSAKNYY